ncbi:MAG: hypothetical protein HYX92_12915 [Chloroflexi bacterium]|nr:hypothetical protein [Chloroflexota bacterium]
MPSARIQQMQKEHCPKYHVGDDFVKPVFLSVLRSRYYTQSWKATEGEPLSIRRAKAFALYLDNLPLFIRPFENIVGFHAEDPHALPISIEGWEQRSTAQYLNSKRCKEEDLEEWKEIVEYWKPRSLGTIVRNNLDERDWLVAAASNRYMECLPGETGSRTMPDHDIYMNIGLNKVLEGLREKLAGLREEWAAATGGTDAIATRHKINDVTAMIIACEAVLRWTNRFSAFARDIAEKEQDPQRKQELMTISSNMGWVPANPPRTFWEAIQSHWTCFLAYHLIEMMCHGTSLRTDQIFWPWYEKDVIVDKTLPREKALDLIEEYLLHIDELGRPAPVHRRRTTQGNSYLATYTIGGVKPEDGSDACNELTLLILDALDDLRVSHPDHKFRWHPNVNPKVWRRVVEVVRSGLGQPSIKNDPVVIDGLMDHYGFTLEEARSWAVVGCHSPSPTLHWGRTRRDAWAVRSIKALELALNDGVDPLLLNVETKGTGTDDVFQILANDPQIGPRTGDASKFTTFEQVLDAYREQFRWALRKSATIKSIYEYWSAETLKRPFASCLFHRSLEAGRDIMSLPEKGLPWVNEPGTVDTVDALIALKKLVFEDKKHTMEQVMNALKTNWEGYEEMRQEFINAPKWGNNDDCADAIGKYVFSAAAEDMCGVKDESNMSPMRSGGVVTRMWSLGSQVGALPNGRKAGDPIADGGISPHANYDRNGPMAAVLSAAKIDGRKQKSDIFNQKLAPASVAGEAGLRKMQTYIEAALHMGLDMIQFNVVDAKTLRDAQAHPENHQNLVVRISGFNAHFVDLNRFVQDSVIERTEHALV